MLRNLIILGFIFVFYSCKKEGNSSTDFPYQATVLELNSDCGKYMINITKGLDNAHVILGDTSNNGIFIAANLPDSFKVTGLSILLDLRKPNNDELGVCTALGVSYPWIYVTKASYSTCFDYSLYMEHKDDGCILNCPGVIGCDGKTYCNDCEAAKLGIKIKE